MNSTIKIKTPDTHFGVAKFITARFSARAFTDQNIGGTELNTLFEAASWTASSNNEQPWEYYFAHRGSAGFQKIWELFRNVSI